MSIYFMLTSMLTLAVMIGYLNHRFIGMQTTIAIMTGSLLFSCLIILLGDFSFFSDIKHLFREFIGKIDFNTLLMQGMLPYLLFAGSINIDINELKTEGKIIGILAVISTILSTLLIGGLTFTLLQTFGYSISFPFCLLFGALISPTDPIAVLGILKDLNYSKEISVKLAGESLFNDGVGIVLFVTIYTLIYNNQPVTFSSVSSIFIIKALGGMTWGLFLGVIMCYLIKNIDDQKLEVLITLTVVSSGYALAEFHAISGPLAMVISGIFLGNKDDNFFASSKSKQYLITFWELIDEILNAILFLLMGFELLIIDYKISDLIVISIIPLVLFSRYITVALPIYFLRAFREFEDDVIPILTWGGLRGGLAIALALSLPESEAKSIIIALTYSVVVFSIIVQGSTIKHFFK